jgi:hypothetical protein
MDAVTIILEVATEKVVKRIKEVGGQDEAWYNPTAGVERGGTAVPRGTTPYPDPPPKGQGNRI